MSSIINLPCHAQDGFNYQAVVRNADGEVLTNHSIGVEINLRQGSAIGNVVYSETFAAASNQFGILNLVVGTGTSDDDLLTIDWKDGPYFIESSLDINGGTNYELAGIIELLSVPYAIAAASAINDEVEDADADPTNELISSLELIGTTIEVTDASGTYSVDLSPLQDGVEDADSDPTNELQTISRDGLTVTLSDGGGSFTDSVNVLQAGNGISIENNVISAEGCELEIGDFHEGGFIFFLDGSGCHGLISAPFDQADSMRWDNNVGNHFTGASDRHYFGGIFNTGRIVAKYEESLGSPDYQTYAAFLCDTLTLNGYTDWYLPSLSELLAMWANLRLNGIGNFTDGFYWSSTENNAFSTFAIRYNTGISGFYGRYFLYHVRAIRAF